MQAELRILDENHCPAGQQHAILIAQEVKKSRRHADRSQLATACVVIACLFETRRAVHAVADEGE
jgi:hypothetical protein